MNKKSIGILAAVVVIVCAAVFGGIYATRNIGKSEKKITQESAVNRLEKMVKKIEPRTAQPVKSPIEYDAAEDEAAELPDIDTCPVGVEAVRVGRGIRYETDQVAKAIVDGRGMV